MCFDCKKWYKSTKNYNHLHQTTKLNFSGILPIFSISIAIFCISTAIFSISIAIFGISVAISCSSISIIYKKYTIISSLPTQMISIPIQSFWSTLQKLSSRIVIFGILMVLLVFQLNLFVDDSELISSLLILIFWVAKQTFGVPSQILLQEY